MHLFYYLGDVGEPGIGGGYSLSGQKGQAGMCILQDKVKKAKFDILGENGDAGLPGAKGIPGDSGSGMYTESETRKLFEM